MSLVTLYSRAEAPPDRPLRRLAAALTYRDFRVLWFGAFTSSIGTWMQKVAQNWLVLTIAGTSSAFYLGLDSFLGEVPILLFTLIGGVVADRRDRRQLLIMSQCIQMGAAFTLAALVYLDVVRIWHVLTLSVITGLAQAFGGPAYQSLIPSLVDKQHLPNAIALNSIQFNLARVIGPLLRRRRPGRLRHGRVLRAERPLVSRRHCRDSLAARPPYSDRPRAARMREELKSGFDYVRVQPGLIGLIVLAFATTFLGNAAADVPARSSRRTSSAAASTSTRSSWRSPAPAP